MPLVARHPVPAGLVGAALLAFVVVFAFARPEYRPPHSDDLLKIDPADYPAPVSGWTWPNGTTPGSTYDDVMNISHVRPAELAEARAAAAAEGIHPQSLRILNAVRLGPDDLSVIVGGADANGRTCLGFVLPARDASFFCPGSSGAQRLGPQAGFVVARSLGGTFDGRTVHPLFLLGVARADVTRVVVTTRGSRDVLFTRRDGSWGTFDLSRTGRRALVRFEGANGVIATTRLRFPRPGERLVAVRD